MAARKGCRAARLPLQPSVLRVPRVRWRRRVASLPAVRKAPRRRPRSNKPLRRALHSRRLGVHPHRPRNSRPGQQQQPRSR